MAVIKTKRMIMADIRTNRNKHWCIELHDDLRVVTRWGRIGAPARETTLGYGEDLFEAKCREKIKKGYVEQKTLSGTGTLISTALHKTSLQKVAAEQIQTNSSEAQELIKRLAALNVHEILKSTTLQYNAANGTFSTPLGIVTQDAIDEARRVLSTISDYVARSDYQNYQLLRAANRYLNLIPTKSSRLNVSQLFPDAQAVRQQSDLLDRLQASLQMALTSPADPDGTATPKVFEASVNVVHSRSEFRRLRELYKSTLNRSHACAGLELKRVYSVEIASMKKAFEARAASINNVMELWHGTSTANILSILHSGFKVQPPATAAITGKLFGPGLYFALQSTKSLNYGYGYWNGTKSKSCFLFLCDVAVGRYQVPAGGTSKQPPRGYDSYWAKPGRSGVVNDEIVVFDEQQVNVKYLLQFGS